MNKICVIGSLNMDLVFSVERFPLAGETILSSNFSTFFGGKGGNQAVALGKLGANVQMVGKVGDDAYGREYLQHLRDCRVGVQNIKIEYQTPTGMAGILVDHNGENQIVISSGANSKVTPDYLASIWDEVVTNDIFLFQLEIPIDTILYAMKKLHSLGKTVIVDPAPATKLPDQLFQYIDYITPNETEVKFYANRHQLYTYQLKEAANNLLRKGVGTVIAKAGGDGSFIINALDIEHVPEYPVDVVDTTGAGDSFNAGFAFALAQGKDLEEAVLTANAVGAMCTRKIGAQNAMPNFTELQEFLERHRRPASSQ
jgi:ribokinase